MQSVTNTMPNIACKTTKEPLFTQMIRIKLWIFFFGKAKHKFTSKDKITFSGEKNSPFQNKHSQHLIDLRFDFLRYEIHKHELGLSPKNSPYISHNSLLSLAAFCLLTFEVIFFFLGKDCDFIININTIRIEPKKYRNIEH